MLDVKTGETFLHRTRAKQLIDFAGLDYGGNKHPSDIDGFIEWKNKCRVIFEVKVRGKSIPAGQKLLLERIADDFETAGKPTLVIHAINDTPSDEDVLLANCLIQEIYWQGEWYSYDDKDIPVHVVVDRFLYTYGE